MEGMEYILIFVESYDSSRERSFYIKQFEVKWREVNSLSRVRLFATPWTVAYQAPPSMGFSMQEY